MDQKECDLQNYKSLLDTKQIEIDKLNKDPNLLNVRLFENFKEVHDLVNKLNEKDEDCENLNLQVKRLIGDLELKENEIIEFNTKVFKLNDQKQVLKVSLKLEVDKNAKLNYELKIKDGEVNDLRLLLEKNNTERKSLANEVLFQISEVDSLNRKLNEKDVRLIEELEIKSN